MKTLSLLFCIFSLSFSLNSLASDQCTTQAKLKTRKAQLKTLETNRESIDTRLELFDNALNNHRFDIAKTYIRDIKKTIDVTLNFIKTKQAVYNNLYASCEVNEQKKMEKQLEKLQEELNAFEVLNNYVIEFSSRLN